MKADHVNLLWAQLIIAELARNGITQICIAPGSRSSPLALAAANNSDVKTTVHYDERGAAFFALGCAKATGNAAAVICTSGTAVANCFPAVVEASQSCTPLIILSADRPPELQDTGALQTIDQVGIFGKYTRWQFNLPTPDESITAAFVLTTVDQAWYRAAHPPRGPMHLNCMFREPLAPTGIDRDWHGYLDSIGGWIGSGSPFTRYAVGGNAHCGNLDTLVTAVTNSKRGIIIVGPLTTHAEKQGIIQLAEKLDWPLFADISSDLRFCGSYRSNIICHYDLFLRSAELRQQLAPDFVLQLGGTPISKHLQRYLADSGARWLVVTDHPFRQDPAHVVSDRLELDPGAFAAQLVDEVSANRSGLLDALVAADRLTDRVLQDFIATQTDQIFELAVAREMFRQSRGPRGIFLATSMPIRDADAGVNQGDTQLYVSANRGVNGIDGTVAGAVGFACGLQLPVTLLTGDLALLHDLNSLSLVSHSEQPITIVVINNNGGGIFSFLPIADTTEHFEQYFGVPHGMSFDKIAAQFGLPYRRVSRWPEFVPSLSESYDCGQSSLIEVLSDRARNREQHERLWEKIAKEIRTGRALS